MTKYRIIHIPSGEFCNTSDEEIENKHLIDKDIITFGKLKVMGCFSCQDKLCHSIVECHECPWSQEEIEYLIEELP